MNIQSFHQNLKGFSESGKKTKVGLTRLNGVDTPVYENHFWISEGAKAHSLHHFEEGNSSGPSFSSFMIKGLSAPADSVYDPFMGRGTTLVEALLLERRALGNDLSAHSQTYTRPRLHPPRLAQVKHRLDRIRLRNEFSLMMEDELQDRFHEDTLAELRSWRSYFQRRRQEQTSDQVDGWLEMIVMELISAQMQASSDVKSLSNDQKADITRWETKPMILEKSGQLLSDHLPADYARANSLLLNNPPAKTPQIPSQSIQLVVAKLPSMQQLNINTDNNWRKAWCGQNSMHSDQFWRTGKTADGVGAIQPVLQEWRRVLKPNGFVVLELPSEFLDDRTLEREFFALVDRVRLHSECLLINQPKISEQRASVSSIQASRIVVLKK